MGLFFWLKVCALSDFQVMKDVEAAPLLSMSVHTLRKMRCQGVGPAYLKLGKAVRYRLSDLEAYVENQRVAR